MASPGLAVGAGIARGLEKAYSRHLDRKETKRQEDRADALREFALVYPQAAASAEATGDYAALEDFIGTTFPKTAKKTAERRAKSAAAAAAPAPPPLIAGSAAAPMAPPAVADVTMAMPAAGPTLEQPGAVMPNGSVAETQQPLIPSRAAVQPGTPAPKPSPEQDFFGMSMLTPAQRRQQSLDAEIEKTQQTREAWVRVARKLLPELQSVDPAITLEDALRYVSKGELMSAASQRGGASAYRYGVDREAIARHLFGKNYDALDQVQAGIVLREEETKINRESEQRTLGTGAGKMGTPADFSTARENQVPVGTTPNQAIGQPIQTQTNIDRRKSTETLRKELMEIRDGYVDEGTGAQVDLIGVLPRKSDTIGGKLPGLVYGARRRGADPTMPDGRERAARLESKVNGIINTLARAVSEQRGAQTEADALRAEAAVLSARDAIIMGDTVESAQARIDESLRLIDQILGQLPASPVQSGQPAKGAAPAAAAPTGAPGVAGTGTAPAAKKDAQGRWVIAVP